MLHPDALNDLLAPSFPGALCYSQWELFDRAAGGGNRAATVAARERALALCAACPALQRCRAYFDGLAPAQRPRGVCAGVLNTKRSTHTPW